MTIRSKDKMVYWFNPGKLLSIYLQNANAQRKWTHNSTRGTKVEPTKYTSMGQSDRSISLCHSKSRTCFVNIFLICKEQKVDYPLPLYEGLGLSLPQDYYYCHFI